MSTPAGIINPGPGPSGAGTSTGSQSLVTQPPFDIRMTSLAFPVTGKEYGTLARGFMVWEKATGGYNGQAQVNFLFNPSTVEIDQSVSSSLGAQASALFAIAGDNQNLVVPLQQYASWSLLFDRTYELWGSYNSTTAAPGTPASIGVLADINAMQQFTGMKINNATGSGLAAGSGGLSGTALPPSYTGIMQLIPSYVFFGGQSDMFLYGYVSEWDVTITHWSQLMIPMRCVINVSWTMLPQSVGTGPGSGPGTGLVITLPPAPSTTTRVSGR